MFTRHLIQFILLITLSNDKNFVSGFVSGFVSAFASGFVSGRAFLTLPEMISRTLHPIDKRQHGFLPRKSCTTNLLCLIDDVAQNLHKNIGTDIIYFDFAKAFDTVSHDILLHKLKSRFSIDGRLLKFLQDYLKNRRQSVVLNSTKSDILEVRSGVPQGLILGPLLFVLFIDDIYQCIGTNTKIAQFADDTKIWKQILTESVCWALKKK